MNHPKLKSAWHLAYQDIIKSFMNWPLWWHLSWTELRRNYNRTLFGPFWASISSGIFISALGVVYSKLWHHDISTYLPFICVSYLSWSLISLTLTEAGNTFINAGNTIKEIPIRFTIFAIDTVFRNIINFLHCMIVFVFIALWFPVDINLKTLLFLPNLLLVSLNLTWAVLLIGILCARFRDIKPIMASILQISFFITPVLWEPERLKDSAFLFFVKLNPFYHAVNLLRNPLLGRLSEPMNYFYLLILLSVGWLLTLWCFSKARSRIIFWV